MSADREQQVGQAFMSLVAGLVDGEDLVELYVNLTQSCADLLDVASAGLLLADTGGLLHVAAASSESLRDLDLFQLQRNEGPCLDCFRGGVVVVAPDLSADADRWPHFAAAAQAVGFVSVHALPLRLHQAVLGALGLFGTAPGRLSRRDLELAQSLAHVAAVALVAGRAAADRTLVNEQLQRALDSRVKLEQAKGLISQLGDIGVDQAFAAIRRYARDHNMRLGDVAAGLVSRQLAGDLVLAHARRHTT
jgi:transcriptional regulator with GAF, ATPase, and Fis domain